MEDQGVREYLKGIYKRAGMMGKLIAINIGVFLLFGILALVEFLFETKGLYNTVGLQFAGPGNPEELLYKPWTLITQLFTHFDPIHLLFNMIMLFFIGRVFIVDFGEKRMLTTYILAGISGYLLHIGCYYGIPAFQKLSTGPVVGASGAIYGLFAAVGFHRPKREIYLFGMFKMPIIVLFLVVILLDFLRIGADDGVAHLAHLGGAIFGVLSVQNVTSKNNFMNRFERFLARIKWPKFLRRGNKMKVLKSDTVKKMDDDQYRTVKAENQEVIDAILDKINKKGYEGLTKEEKEILFNESKRK